MTMFEGWTLGTAIVTGVCSMAAVIIAIRAMTRRQDVNVEQPLVVRPDDEFVNKDDFTKMMDANEQAHRDLFSKIGGVERGGVQALNSVRQEMHGMELRINSSGEERSAKIHDRVNEVLAEVSEIRGELKRLET